MSVLIVRSYGPDDEASVVALWHACGLVRSWNDPAKDIARKATVQPDLFLVGLVDDALVASAMIGYDGHRGWVNYLAVDPDHRQRGHARRMMAEAERRLIALGCPKLNLQVRRSNQEAFAFYLALGYVEDEAVSFGKRLIPD